MVIKQNIIYRTNISSIVLDHTLKLSFVRSNVVYLVHCKLYTRSFKSALVRCIHEFDARKDSQLLKFNVNF